MTPRSIRRAAERRANKLARKSAQPGGLLPAENRLLEGELSPQQTVAETFTEDAAAANASLSAVTSVLTGGVTLLPDANAAQYDRLIRDYQSEFQPLGLRESGIVQTLAETAWRTRRLLALEMALLAKGRIEFAAQYSEHKPELRPQLIDVHTFLIYEKQIRGLQLQEARLTRRADKLTAELHNLQNERGQRAEVAEAQMQADRQHELAAVAQLYAAARQNRQPFQPPRNGFVFSNQEIEAYLAQKQRVSEHFAALSLPLRAEAA